ncbi:MAG: ACT domain-containing protein [Bryobacteraceae bacterium]
MKIHQLSLFVENKPGALIEPCRLLAREAVNIRTLSVADTREFGILRLIVSDWKKAEKALRDAGFVVNVTEVLAVEVPDRPGGLAGIIEAFENSPVNIEYMYAFTSGRGDKAVIIFRFDQPDAAITLLQSAGINVVDSVEVYGGVFE